MKVRLAVYVLKRPSERRERGDFERSHSFLEEVSTESELSAIDYRSSRTICVPKPGKGERERTRESCIARNEREAVCSNEKDLKAQEIRSRDSNPSVGEAVSNTVYLPC